MTPLLWLVVAVVVAAVIFLAVLVRSGNRRADLQLSATRQEMQNSLATQGQNFTSQLNHLMQSVTQQLGQVRQELQSGISSSGQLTSDAQKNVSEQLKSATEAVRQISQQLGAVQKAGEDLTKASQTMQQVLGGAKSRGTLGEIGLERMLEDALPQGSFELQHRFSTGDVVDAVVRSGNRLICIDSKFPFDSYRRLMELGEDSRKEFSQAVRKHADSIAAKYILPGEETLDIALMFVPSETVYYELLMTDAGKNGRLDEYCRAKAVFPVSPNTLYAYLNMILMGLRGMQIEENAKHLRENLGGVKKQFDVFAEVFEKLSVHLRHAQQSYDDAGARLDRARNSLEQMSQGVLAEPAQKSLQPASEE